MESSARLEGSCGINEGEEVWVKPPNVRCTSQWKKGVVTRVNSSNNVEVDGMPRHILDVRIDIDERSESECDTERENSGRNKRTSDTNETEPPTDPPPAIVVRRNPVRTTRQPPSWLSEYEH